MHLTHKSCHHLPNITTCHMQHFPHPECGRERNLVMMCKYMRSRIQRGLLHRQCDRYSLCEMQSQDGRWSLQGSRIRLVLGCVISPLRQHAESRNLGQTLFGSPVCDLLSMLEDQGIEGDFKHILQETRNDYPVTLRVSMCDTRWFLEKRMCCPKTKPGASGPWKTGRRGTEVFQLCR